MTYSWNCEKTMLPIANVRSESWRTQGFGQRNPLWMKEKTLAVRR